MKPSKWSVKKKNEARKAKENILLPAHSRTSQANILHLDQKVAKCIACSKLSDSGEDAKEWGRREGGRHAKRWRNGKKEKGKKPFPPVFFFFHVRAFSVQRTRLYRSLDSFLPSFILTNMFSVYRFKVDMSQFPVISRIHESLSELEAFMAAHPSQQPDCPEDLRK